MTTNIPFPFRHGDEKKPNPIDAALPVDCLKVPIDLLGYRASPQVIGRFKLEAIRALAKKFSPNIFTLLLEVSGEHEIEACLCANADSVEGETHFWEEMTKGLFFLDRTRVSWLVARGLEFQPNESKCDYVARVLIDHAEVVHAVLFSWLQESGEDVGGRSYLVFPSTKSAVETSALLTAVKKDRLGAALKPYFYLQGYGDHCEVIPVEEAKGKRGFVLDRCGHQDAKFVLDSANQRKQRLDRDLLTDYVFFHEDSNSLWVHARTPRDGRNYADTIASLTGCPELFQAQLTFDLSSLNTFGFAASLTGVKQKFRKEVSLRYVVKKDPQINLTARVAATRYERCLAERMQDILGNPLTEIRDVGFAVTIDPTKKRTGKIDFSNGKIKLGEGVTVEQAMDLATGLGFIGKPYANA